jgi:hypothetical protein
LLGIDITLLFKLPLVIIYQQYVKINDGGAFDITFALLSLLIVICSRSLQAALKIRKLKLTATAKYPLSDKLSIN